MDNGVLLINTLCQVSILTMNDFQKCYVKISEYSKGNFERKIILYDHTKIQGSSHITRDHSCAVCEIGKASLHDFEKHQMRAGKTSVGRPLLKNYHQPTPVKLCSFCLTQICKGKEHTCSLTTKQSNLKQIISGAGDAAITLGEQLASSVIKEKNKEARR